MQCKDRKTIDHDFSIERLSSTYNPPVTISPSKYNHEMNTFLNTISNTSYAPSTMTNDPPVAGMWYDEYLRMNYPEQYAQQSVVREDATLDVDAQNAKNVQLKRFNNFFSTSAVKVKINRQRNYHQSREKVQRHHQIKLAELNNFRQPKQNIQDFLNDYSWRFTKSRPQTVDFALKNTKQKNVFDKKNASNDERRFNNFNTKNFEVKVRTPLLDNLNYMIQPKPLLNNMETPLVYYDNIQEVYQKITFGETMQKCLFDYSKAAKRETPFDSIDPKAVSREEIKEIVRKQEIIDHNIERMRNRLAINKAYPVPLFDQYMPRTRPSSHQLRWVQRNQNHFEDAIQKEEMEKEWANKQRAVNRTISPSDWKRDRKKSS